MLESFHGVSLYTESYLLRVVGTLCVPCCGAASRLVSDLPTPSCPCSFLVSFMCLFNYVFMMALIAINEEAFFQSRCAVVLVSLRVSFAHSLCWVRPFSCREDGIDVDDGRKLPIMLRALLQNIHSGSANKTAPANEPGAQISVDGASHSTAGSGLGL